MNFHVLPDIKVNTMALKSKVVPQVGSKLTQNEQLPGTNIHARREQQ